MGKHQYKPKFKVGQWIGDKYGISEITSINDRGLFGPSYTYAPKYYFNWSGDTVSIKSNEKAAKTVMNGIEVPCKIIDKQYTLVTEMEKLLYLQD